MQTGYEYNSKKCRLIGRFMNRKDEPGKLPCRWFFTTNVADKLVTQAGSLELPKQDDNSEVQMVG